MDAGLALERSRNPRLGGDRTLAEFAVIMRELELPYPKFIDYAVPGNRQCGVCPLGIADDLKQYCETMEASPQG